MPGFEPALADGAVSSGHVDAVANAARGLDDAGRERLGGLAGRFVELRPGRTGDCVRTALPAAGQTLGRRRRRIRARQTESGGVGATLGRQTVRDAPHPPRFGSRSVTPSCGRRSTPSWRRSNRPTATPAARSMCCWPTLSSPPCRGNGRGSGGCRRSVSMSTTTRCSTVCTNIRCVRPPTGSRSHPRRCAVWRVRRRSCRSCSTAPVRCWTAAATSGLRTGRSGGRYGRCTAPAATPAATSCSIVATSTTSSNGSATAEPIWTICCRCAAAPPPRARRTLATRHSTNTG